MKSSGVARVDHGRSMVRRGRRRARTGSSRACQVGRAGPSVPGRHRRPEAGSELTAAATLSTIHGMWKPRKPRVGDEYVTGSLRDGILMIVVILAAIVVIWLAYGWALGVPGVPAAP